MPPDASTSNSAVRPSLSTARTISRCSPTLGTVQSQVWPHEGLPFPAAIGDLGQGAIDPQFERYDRLSADRFGAYWHGTSHGILPAAGGTGKRDQHRIGTDGKQSLFDGRAQ